MSFNAPDIEAGTGMRDWRRSQVVADTYQRSKLAGFLYLFGWTVVALLGRAYQFEPVLTVGLGAAFLLLGTLRLRMRPPGASRSSGIGACPRSWSTRRLS